MSVTLILTPRIVQSHSAYLTTASYQTTVYLQIVHCEFALNPCLSSVRTLLDFSLSHSPTRRAHSLARSARSFAYSDPTRSEFFWVPPQDEDDTGSSIDQTPEDERFYIITNELIRARIVSETFSDVTPKVAPKAIAPAAPAAAAAAANKQANGNTAGGGAATGGPGQGHAGGIVEVQTAGPAPYRLEVGATHDCSNSIAGG